MIVGTTATATMGIGFLVTKSFDSFIYFRAGFCQNFIYCNSEIADFSQKAGTFAAFENIWRFL